MSVHLIFEQSMTSKQSQTKVKKKAKIRNRYNQVPHLTQDTIRESDKTQEKITHKRAKRSALSQAGIHKDAREKQYSIVKINMKLK